MAEVQSPTAPRLAGGLLVLCGVVLLVMGLVLVSEGGLPAPAVIGLGFIASGVLLARRRAVALAVYAVLLVLMLAWAIAEAGLDWWPLAARLDLAFVFGLLLLLPPVWRPLAGARGSVLALAVVYAQFSAQPAVAGALRGMGAVAAGLIAGVGIKLFVSIRNHPLGRPLCLAITALTIIAMALLRWPLFWILPVIGGAACLLTWRKLAP